MRTWLITGCSSGIGRGVAQAALDAGDNVVVTARNPDAIREFKECFPDRALAVMLDVTDVAQCSRAVRAAEERFGNIDVLVNNAGYGYRAAVEESARPEVERLFETNFYGPARLMNLVLPSMRRRRSGTIVNVTSMGAVRAAVGNAYYSASKAALEMVSDGLRKEAAPLGIRVMMVEPGAFRTNFYDSLAGSNEGIGDYDATVAAMRVGDGAVPHDQPGDPLEAGRVIVEMVGRDELPERLALGSDAVSVLEGEYRQRLEELGRMRSTSARTDFDEHLR
jgi:NAD(P)-dependent dehydrogenase (short-subunit alcohol dehydrogenase family)